MIVASFVGELLLGRVGSQLLPGALMIAAFIKPRSSMWLESVLFATRTVGLVRAAFHFAFMPLILGRVGDPVLGGIMLILGLAAFFRIRALLRTGEICPAAIGTAKENQANAQANRPTPLRLRSAVPLRVLRRVPPARRATTPS